MANTLFADLDIINEDDRIMMEGINNDPDTAEEHKITPVHGIPETATGENGEALPYRITIADGIVMFSDNLTDMVGTLVGNYDLHYAEFALVQRIIYAMRVANELQRNANEEADGFASDAEELFAKTEYVTEAESNEEQKKPLSGPWESATPLYVVASDYAPYTELPLPAGNVLVLDPTTEKTFLDTLTALGEIDFTKNESQQADSDEQIEVDAASYSVS